MDWEEINQLLNELEQNQSEQLFVTARRIVPHLTSDDLLQPNDFAELENHPNFRYEEGVLAGIQTVKMALLALKSDQKVQE